MIMSSFPMVKLFRLFTSHLKISSKRIKDLNERQKTIMPYGLYTSSKDVFGNLTPIERETM